MLVAGVLLGPAVTAQADNLEVATVDMQEVLMVHPSIMDAQQQIQEEQMEMMAELEDMDEEEAAMQQQQMQQQLQQMQQDLLEDAIADVETDIEDIAAELGYNVVLNSEGIVSGEENLDSVDITEDIMEEFNGDAEDMQPEL
ncbi:Outer membrane protein (OmpH-like) [Halarsenatibacter silvermanii]|uniref:Outer membrane protein (OmpH-like) n=1 Tax=Halarsenatibacter silvermanii TaxID=321763 RepID=A0A1G9KPM8_9FIRM|nr:Outer membrane protein (OmpH-like) [Halarsenatibacter silvermanii]